MGDEECQLCYAPRRGAQIDLFGGRMSLIVDPEMLRQFSSAVAGTSESLAGLDVSSPFVDCQEALPGTEISTVSVRGCDAVAAALRNVCVRLGVISQISTGTANNYEVSEADFSEMLNAMDVHP